MIEDRKADAMNQDNQSDRYVDFMKNSFCFFTMTSGCICISLLAEQTPNKAQGLRDSVDAFARHRPAEYIEKPRRRRNQAHAVSTEPFRDSPRQPPEKPSLPGQSSGGKL